MKTFWTVLFTSFVFGAVAGAQYPTNAPILGPDLRIASAISGGKLNLVGGNLVIDAGFKDTSTVEASFNSPLTCNGAVSFDGGIYANGNVFFDAGTTMLNGNLVVDGGTVLYGTVSIDGGVTVTGVINASGRVVSPGGFSSVPGVGAAGDNVYTSLLCTNSNCTNGVNSTTFISAATTGNNAVTISTLGARVDFGTGAMDFLFSDAGTITTGGAPLGVLPADAGTNSEFVPVVRGNITTPLVAEMGRGTLTAGYLGVNFNTQFSAAPTFCSCTQLGGAGSGARIGCIPVDAGPVAGAVFQVQDGGGEIFWQCWGPK